ncbi:MAG: prolipoprotein diacylglyceryl transferase [Pseudomonadota bacterium]
MSLFVLPYPIIDPVLIQIGPIAIRWYALAYLAGLVLGWFYIANLLKSNPLWARTPGGAPLDKEALDDLLFWVTLGVIIGGRIGFELFYRSIYYPNQYLQDPLIAFKIWRGGMSFHGGLIGVMAVLYFFCRSRGISMLRVGDLVAAAVPIGIFFGRVANFINGELYGKPSDVPWAMVFPSPAAGDIPRHPSQLYEAALEGLVLFFVLRLLITRFRAFDRPGLVTGVFLAGYGLARAFVEIFRDSDAYLFSQDSGLTMGMALSIPMWIVAFLLIRHALKAPSPPSASPAGGRQA